jgi:hypothetical protein
MSNNSKSLIGQPINIQRMNTWRWPSSTLCVPSEDLKKFAPIQKPKIGDLALTEVVTLGANTFIENTYGCNMSIFPGTVILGVFAPRYAPDEYEARVPETLNTDEEIALLNRGGTIGEVLSSSSYHTGPTMLNVLAFIENQKGLIANTRDYAKPYSDTPYIEQNKDRSLIIVVGSSMNAGKSNVAKSVVYSLAACGKRVAAGKATGQAARRDILLMEAAGAIEIMDFIDLGLPSTYLLPQEEVLSVFWKIFNHLFEKAGPGGYIVIELADGILQRETAMILSDSLVQNQVDKLVYACSDPLSAAAGVEILKSRYNLTPTAISGRAANSELGLREVQDILGNIPTFDSMNMEVPLICSLMINDT